MKSNIFIIAAFLRNSTIAIQTNMNKYDIKTCTGLLNITSNIFISSTF